MIMDTTSTADTAQQQSPAYGLMKRGKRGAAALIAAACCNTPVVATTISQQQQDDGGGDTAAADSALTRCKLLDEMLDVMLNPYDAISEWNNLDWIRWLMAGGKTLDEFSSAVKVYDYGTCCGLVWTANYVAYRCRTCSISPCMSLCGDCFKRGDHTGHDFNMFRSQAGGACDCGDTSVMKPDGFCSKHSSTINIDGSSTSTNSGCKQPPADLLRVAERIMPRLLLRLVQYLRENSKIADSRTSNTHVPPGGVGGAGAGMTNQQHNLLLKDLDPFLGMLHEFGALGAAMRRVMTVSLTNERIYRWACDYYSSAGNYNVGSDSSLQEQQQQPQQTIYTIYTDKVRRYYAEAIHQYTASTASTSLSSSSSSRRRHSDTSTVDAIHGINSLNSSEEEEDDDEFGQDDWLVDGQISRGRKNKLNHSSFLQEIVFWTVRYEFPQKMVCFLLNMLPDAAYKEALTEAFVMHYGCVARVLATTRDSDTLSNHIVHISVQLFSNEALATRMVDKLGLLRIMVSSLRRMMTKILIPSTLHNPLRNRHRVVDCSKAVMKEHCYWPLVSDLNNVLSHRPIAVKFMCDDRLLDSWFSYLSMFQGMNVNCRELGHHIEFEPNTYYAAFSAELEASAYPMWAMLSHLTSADTLSLSSRVLRACLKRLRKWLMDVGYYYDQDHGNVCGGTASTSANYNTNASTTIIRRLDDRHQFTFHLPLHRYLAVFLCQAVRAQSARIEDIIPQSSTDDSADRDALLMAIAGHPLRAQSAFYEIMQGAWVRNGLQIKGQAMTYIQSNFCISMVDADIYLLQLCLSELSDANIFMSLILEKFKVYDWMHVIKHGGLPQVMDSEEYDAAPSMEGLLVFLATLIGVRTNLCSDEDYDYCQSQLEMVTLLCVSDKTHSQLMELMPERCGGLQTSATTTSSPNTSDGTSRNPPSIDQDSPPAMRDFETVLQAVAEYKRPQFEASGNMQQGLYVPLAHVWQKLYDPVHVLLRAVHRRDFQSSMDRYTTFMRSIGMLKQNQNTWPPYRMPQKHHPAYRNPCRALLSKLFHAVVWHCLYRSAVYRDISEHTLSLLIYLLDQAWIFYSNSPVDNKISNNQQQPMDTDPPAKQSASSSSTASSGECFYESPNIQSCPKRKIKITVADASISDSETTNAKETTLLMLNRWYDNDDLAHNLCTTITHVELPPPYYHYFFAGEATNTTSNATAASTMATNLFDYFTSSVSAAASVASSSSPVNVSHNFEPGNSQEQPNVVPSLATIAGNEIPLASSSIPTRPPFYSLNAAAAATSSTMDSALNRVKQRLQFLRPPPPKTDSPTHDQHQSSSSSSSSVIIDLTVPEFPFEAVANNDNEASILGVDSNVVIKVDDQQNSLVCINESIISLLLKLHSQLSGEPDSYRLPIILPHPTSSNNLIDEANQSASENDNIKEEVPPCGDGAFFVGRLLDRIARGSTSCYDCILRTRMALWPIAVVMRETASRDDEERERRERKRRARDKQQQMMEEMARAQQAFLESARRSGDLDSTDTQSTCATSTIMECDVPPPTVDISTLTTSVNEASTSTLANTLVELDENSSSSNSTTTTKESATHIRGPDQHETMLTVDCVICNQTVIVQIEQQRQDPVGLVILVQGTNVLAHRRHIVSQPLESTNLYNANNSNTTERHQQKLQDTEKATGLTISNKVENNCLVNSEQNYYHYWPALPPLNSQQHHQQSTSVINDPKSQQQHNQPIVTTIADNYDATTYASHSDRRKRLLSQYFNNLDKADFEVGSLTTTTSATPVGGNVHVQTCGHHLHLRCWSSYLASLRGAQRFNSDRGEYSCPLCRQLANSLMPLIPEVTIEQNQQQRGSTPYNTIITMSSMSDAVNKLTELVKQQEYESPNPVQSSDVVCCSEKSTSVFIGETENIVNRHPLHQNVHHHRYNDDDYFMMQHQVHDIIPAGGVEDGNGGNVGEAEDLESGEDPLLNAVNRCVSDMITTTVVTAAAQTVSLPHTLLTSTQREKMYKVRWHSVVSVAWTNIQVELVQRNNSLIELLKQGQSSLHRGNNDNRRLNLFSATAVNATDINGSNNYYNMLPKRNCIAPLLKVLRVSARSLMAKYQTPDYNPISDVWHKLTGCEQPRQQLSSTYPPLLMRDPCSVLLQLVLLLPTLDRDLFDTLIKLTYNMQLYVAALKVASTWNRNCKFNRQFYHRQQHCSSLNTKNISTRNEEITDGSSSVQMDLDDGYNNKLSSLSMDITEDDNTLPLTPLFSQVVALAKTIVFLSDDDETEIVNIGSIVNNDDEFMMHQEDEDVENIVSDSKFDGSINASEDDGEILLLLESYGRRSTLPFLRFAALLKKYINGDDDDNIDDHPELTISSPQLNNLIVEQNKQREQPLDCQVISPPQVEVDCNVDFSTTNDNYHHQHWSNDDYEYLMLARYLKLLNNNEEAHEVSDHYEETYNSNCSYIERNDYQNQSNFEKRHNIPLQPPSAMEAVIWPEWSYSTNDKNNKISTTISRTWFTSFRESLTTKIPKATIVGENATTIVSSAAAEIDPNSKATTSANIIMATRMLLFADCCDSGGASDDTRASILGSSRSLFPPITWAGPRLLKLPHLYDDVFQYYHGRACHRCHGVPRETSVCLVCGTVVCLKENCCKTNHIYEAVQHSLECGGGTGMFLVVTSSSVVVIRGKRACLWGSVYLDAFGEEDRELKRGKPLYLSAERYRLLEHQWLAHRFDHTNKKWVWHRDAL